uniref:tubulin monoglycylase TTLL3 isoform X3 n=1 Tax=Pristiophorus japonicus TaxID=55135 RepID=UPI00398E9FCA
MAGGTCPKDDVSENQDESVQRMEGIRLKQNCKSQYTEAKGTNKSCGSLVTRDVKFHRHHIFVSEVNLDRLKNCKCLVEKAVKLKKIFSIYGPYPMIRQSLRNRGWLEKRLPKLPKCPQKKDKIINGESDPDDGVGDSDGCDSDDKQVDEKDSSDDPNDVYNIMAGLCVNLKNFQWFNGVNPDSFFPRCYRIAVEEEKQSFIEDFRMTAARSILKWVAELKKKSELSQNRHDQRDTTPRSSVLEDDPERTRKKGGVVPIQLVKTALRACEEYLNAMDHKDIDVSLDTPPAVTERCWEETIQQYYEVIHDGATIQNWNFYAALCEKMLLQLQQANTQLKMEGMHNIWIVKPGAQSRGRGITCMNRLDQIVKLVYGQTTLITDGKWVVQKYIEHPLLIYGTKFDMRQWFLVTDWNPVTIWFYRDCYLRFSTQAFSLDNLDTSIHLCNNSIQKHFTTSSNRHPLVPGDNIWSSTQFKQYLNKNGFENIWEDIISPGMKNAIVHTMQIMQDAVKPRKNSFELYGADFLLGEDFKPWLIEINCSPTMSPSTPVTAKLCSSVQEDTIKVVIDRRNEKTCDTGGFELLYKQCTMNIPLYLGINLLVEGSSIKKPSVFIPSSHSSDLHSISQIAETVQKICGTTSQNRQIILNDNANRPANAENAKIRDSSKIFSNPSKSKYSLIDSNPEFPKCPLIPNNSTNAKNSNTSNVKNPLLFITSGNEKSPLVPKNCSIARIPLNPNNYCVAKVLLTSNNCSMIKHPLSPNNYGIAKHPLNPNNSSTTKNTLNPTNSSTTNSSLIPNNSSDTKVTLNLTHSCTLNNLLNRNNSSITNSSLIPNKSSNIKNPLLSNNSNDVHNSIAPNPSIAKNHNISQNSNNIFQDHGSPNRYSKEKTLDITNNSSKIKISSGLKHLHKIRNLSTYNCKKARNVSNPRIKAWDEMEKIKNNIAKTAQAAVTGNLTKIGSDDEVEQHYALPWLRKTGKQHLPPKSKISQMSTPVKHLILPNRQILRDPLTVKLKCLSLDILNFKDMHHSRSSTTTDANRVRAIPEKTAPLRYSYNSPQLQLKDPYVPLLHITGLQPQFKAASDISNNYIETRQTATTSLFNIKKHLLTSSFPLFQ